MNQLFIKVLFIFLFTWGSQCWGEEAKKADVYCDELGCNKVSPWKLGLGIGGGKRSNPLVNSDDIDIYWFFDLAYFGDTFFFDNGDLGATVFETENLTINTIVSYGNEKAFFSHLNDENFSLAPISDEALTGADAVDQPRDQTDPNTTAPAAVQQQAITVDIINNRGETTTVEVASTTSTIEIDPPKRDRAIEGGVELHYDTGFGNIQSQLMSDISAKHNGLELWLSYSYPILFENLKIQPAVGFEWKSHNLQDYYYGIKADEAFSLNGTTIRPEYEANSGTNWFAKLSIAYRLSQRWQIVGIVDYEKLNNDIIDSPIVEDKKIVTAFAGIFYRFK